MGFGYMPLEIGVSKFFGMTPSTFNYPSFNDFDSYAHLHDGLSLAVNKSIAMLKKYCDSYDYFYIHFKETDIPGHDNKPLEKVKLIELLDRDFFGFLRTFINGKDCRLIVTADHTTSCRAKAHTSHPVPVLFFDGSNSLNSSKRFNEKDSIHGKAYSGIRLLKETLFS